MNSINKKTKTQFPDDFFKEEVRSEYTVTEKSKKVWAIEIDLLNNLLDVCKKYNIKVYAFAGTILGAVRHKGFIPWDDDIDVCMVRDDYERFLEVASKEFKYPYFLQTPLSDKECFFGCSRLRNSETTGFITTLKSVSSNSGIFIDIFVLDGFIEDTKLYKKQLKEKELVEKLITAYHPEYVSNRFKKVISYVLKYTFCKAVKYEKVVGWYNKILSRYNSVTNRLSILTSPDSFIQRYWCWKSDLDEVVYMDFENIKIPVPYNYEKMLTNMYGNYMQLPPKEKRGDWHQGIIVFEPDIPYKDYLKNI